MDESFTRGEVEDLTSLSKLDEQALLEELQARYQKNLIYTYIGDILIAVNPFRDLGIYDKETSEKYGYARKSSNPPHIFAMADIAYQNMLGIANQTPQNQCILISGESGAGKTESTKLIMKQLMELCKSNSQLEQQIIQVNPLLEAFGNAQTLMNDNSSRFGKYIQLKFKDGHVKGGKISEYLLEKSRVVFQNPDEQNFHIFYYMLAGLSDENKKALLLTDTKEFRYMHNSHEIVKNKMEVLQERYQKLCDAMDWVGFTDQEQLDVFKAMASILYIGNTTFVDNGNEELSVVQNKNSIEAATTLLSIDYKEVMHALTSLNVFTAGEMVKRNYTMEKAEDARDAMAKAIYGRLFGWIVNKFNCLIAPIDPDHVNFKEIGILDIFGFEHFDDNSFEQACINLANEQLHFFFNQYVFKLEQEEYKKEGIDWKEIQFIDNRPLLNMFLEKPGLLSILDDESQFPKATDITLVDKLNETIGNTPYYVKSSTTHGYTFTIKHYAANVTYNTTNWLEKNRDTQPAEILEILKNSKNPLIRTIFNGQLTRTGSLALQGRSSVGRANKVRMAFNTTQVNRKEDKQRKLTVGAQFKHSLKVLMEKMNSAVPIFVRCLKPNHQRKPQLFDEKYILAQLQYTGVLETTKIRREGYAIRPTFAEFVNRYKILVCEWEMSETKENCLKILKKNDISGYQIGKTRVFLKYLQMEQLGDRITEVNKAARNMQRVARGFLARRRYKRMQEISKKHVDEMKELIAQLSIVGEAAYEQQQATIKFDKYNKETNKKQEKKLISPSKVKDTDDELSEGEIMEDDFTQKALGKYFESERRSRYGPAGSPKATINWFVETQMNEVKAPSGEFAPWFHGVISRREAERLLSDCEIGCYLIRVSESRFGYSLSFRDINRCRHYMIDQLSNGKYVIIGEPKPHRTLSDLIEYHKKVKISNWKHLLKNPCPQSTVDAAKLPNVHKKDQARLSEYLVNKRQGPPLPKRNNLRPLSKTVDPKKLNVPLLPTTTRRMETSPKSSPKPDLKNKRATHK